jgi:hypothetical protein
MRELRLGAHLDFNQSPVVNSSAKMTLFNDDGSRIYNAQVILGHQVSDDTFNYLIYNAQIITEIGLANSATSDDASRGFIWQPVSLCIPSRHAHALRISKILAYL